MDEDLLLEPEALAAVAAEVRGSWLRPAVYTAFGAAAGILAFALFVFWLTRAAVVLVFFGIFAGLVALLGVLNLTRRTPVSPRFTRYTGPLRAEPADAGVHPNQLNLGGRRVAAGRAFAHIPPEIDYGSVDFSVQTMGAERTPGAVILEVRNRDGRTLWRYPRLGPVPGGATAAPPAPPGG